MADVIDHHLRESSSVAPAPESNSVDDEEDAEGFTFAAASPLAAGGELAEGRTGPVFPVFGRPRSPPLQEQEEDPGSATVRVPLGQLLLEERGSSSPGQGQPDDGGDLYMVPARNYCLWSPGRSPVAAGSGNQSPSCCQKSGSTGSVFRWRQWLLGRSNSDSQDKFVYVLNTERDADGGGNHVWRSDARGGDGDGGRIRSSFLPYSKKDLVGLFANAGAFRGATTHSDI